MLHGNYGIFTLMKAKAIAENTKNKAANLEKKRAEKAKYSNKKA